GQQVVGRVVQALKSSWGMLISQNTLDFLVQLKDPACNDRKWFVLLSGPSFNIYHWLKIIAHFATEPVYCRTEKEFTEEFTNMLTEVDSQIHPLPSKDVIHRIYRDIRFSNDKTLYKRRLSASFSRSRRNGIFAFCEHRTIYIFRSRCLTSRRPRTLHTTLSSKAFTTHFGAPRPHLRGERQSVFRREDELKVAPKGVHQNHKDITLLKYRSLAVSCQFTPAQVVAPGSEFIDALHGVVDVMTPFVHCLDDLVTLPVEDEFG
ncbi:hypothetical protein DFH29DRAFT_806714, partial [Suillus ampliporus]